MVSIDDGIGPINDLTPGKALTIVAFTAVALYNVIELTFIIFMTFKRKSGLYFISFCVATWSIPFYSVGFLLKHLNLTTLTNLYSTLLLLGWFGLITGQSVVLYSRLHLLDRNRTRLRAVLVMIIVNAIIMQIPIAIMVYGSNGLNPEPWMKVYTVYEKIQISVFFVQELIISGLYIAATMRMFKFEGALRGRRPGKVLKHLLIINVVIICLDITILGLEFAGMYDLQTSWKALVYSVKLKMEFSILNSLIDITKGDKPGSSAEQRDYFAGVQGSSKDKESRRARSNPRRMDSEQMTRHMEHIRMHTIDSNMSSAARGKGPEMRPANTSYTASVDIGEAEEGFGAEGHASESSQEGIMVSRTTVVRSETGEVVTNTQVVASTSRRRSDLGSEPDSPTSADFAPKASSSSSEPSIPRRACCM